jgi:hypothetical protein
MASSKNEAVYAAVGADFPEEEDSPIAEAIVMQVVEVQAPCDMPEGYQLSVEIHGKKTVVAVVCTEYPTVTRLEVNPLYSYITACFCLRHLSHTICFSPSFPSICSPQAAFGKVKTSTERSSVKIM